MPHDVSSRLLRHSFIRVPNGRLSKRHCRLLQLSGRICQKLQPSEAQICTSFAFLVRTILQSWYVLTLFHWFICFFLYCWLLQVTHSYWWIHTRLQPFNDLKQFKLQLWKLTYAKMLPHLQLHTPSQKAISSTELVLKKQPRDYNALVSWAVGLAHLFFCQDFFTNLRLMRKVPQNLGQKPVDSMDIET